MKAVIYARYSSDSQREESIEGQLRECTAFAEKNGITVLRHYIDRAVSAKTDNRSGSTTSIGLMLPNKATAKCSLIPSSMQCTFMMTRY